MFNLHTERALGFLFKLSFKTIFMSLMHSIVVEFSPFHRKFSKMEIQNSRNSINYCRENSIQNNSRTTKKITFIISLRAMEKSYARVKILTQIAKYRCSPTKDHSRTERFYQRKIDVKILKANGFVCTVSIAMCYIVTKRHPKAFFSIVHTR